MTLEHGFRRLTVAVSLGVLGVSLGLTAYDTFVTARHVAAHKRIAQCLRETKAWTPTREDFQRIPETWRPQLVPGEKQPDELERGRRWTEAARAYRGLPCFQLADGYELPKHLDRAIDIWVTSDLVPLSWNLYMTNETYKLALLPLTWGVLASGILTALPWGAFYLVRGIARGFGG